METITLYTADGAPVTEVQIPPFSSPADGVVWGSRTFFRRPNGQYREGLLYTVVQTMSAERANDLAERNERRRAHEQARHEARQTAALATPRTADLHATPTPPHEESTR